jgi:phosphatidylglycerol:prolipoprotein diacylglycerol transferase
MLPLLIPYWAPKVYNLGPIPIDPWATLVCLGFIIGEEIARARGLRNGMEPRDVVDGAVFIVGMGFLVAHIVHVLAYNPHLLSEDPLILLKVWAGFSSTGGFIGAILGSVIFFTKIRPRNYWKYADNTMYGFAFGWFFGRMGCFSVHDHVGRASDFFLAVDFPAPMGSRHDLGLYEALWVGGIALFFWIADKKPRPNGFFLAAWCMLYTPARFTLDFLRNDDLSNADVRWGSLTPAQYGSIAIFLVGVALITRIYRRAAAPAPTEE